MFTVETIVEFSHPDNGQTIQAIVKGRFGNSGMVMSNPITKENYFYGIFKEDLKTQKVEVKEIPKSKAKFHVSSCSQ